MPAPIDDSALVHEMGRQLTGIVSPAELPFYDEVVASQDAPAAKRRDHTMAFGVSPNDIGLTLIMVEVAKIVIKGVWEAAKPLLSGLAEDAGKELRTALSARIKDWITDSFQKKPPVTLSPDNVRDILDAVKREVASKNLPEAQQALVEQTITRALGTTAG